MNPDLLVQLAKVLMPFDARWYPMDSKFVILLRERLASPRSEMSQVETGVSATGEQHSQSGNVMLDEQVSSEVERLRVYFGKKFPVRRFVSLQLSY